MKKLIALSVFFGMLASCQASAAPEAPSAGNEKQKAVVPANTTGATKTQPEAFVKLVALQTQKNKVAQLKKSLDAETAKLSQMRASFVQTFGVDPKKVEKDGYHFDWKSGKIVEK